MKQHTDFLFKLTTDFMELVPNNKIGEVHILILLNTDRRESRQTEHKHTQMCQFDLELNVPSRSEQSL